MRHWAFLVFPRLRQRHGTLMVTQSGGCCDGSSPMCHPDGDVSTGDADVRLGDLYVGGPELVPMGMSRGQSDPEAGRPPRDLPRPGESRAGRRCQTPAVAPDLAGWRRRLDPFADLAVAAAVLLLSLLPLLHARDCGCDPAPTWGFVLVVAQALPLVVRRRWPFATSLLSGLLALSYGLSSLPDPPVPYAGLVAMYSVAAYSSRRLSQLAAVIAVAGIGVAMVVDWPKADLQDVAVNYLVFATAWLLGDGARTRRERAGEAEERAAQAERTRAAEAERAVVAERNRIAREMHDVVAHHVSLMVVQAEAGPVVVERDPARAAEAFDYISATGKQALTEMRRLLGVLREDGPGERAPQPGLDRLGDLVEGVRAAGLDVVLEVRGEPRPLPPAVDLSAYRLVQEALTNVTRHAGPARAHVLVEHRLEGLRVEVVDDGIGARGADLAPGGHGLVAMRERVALVGGVLRVGPAPSGGWSVRADLPVEVAAR